MEYNLELKWLKWIKIILSCKFGTQYFYYYQRLDSKVLKQSQEGIIETQLEPLCAMMSQISKVFHISLVGCNKLKQMGLLA